MYITSYRGYPRGGLRKGIPDHTDLSCRGGSRLGASELNRVSKETSSRRCGRLQTQCKVPGSGCRGCTEGGTAPSTRGWREISGCGSSGRRVSGACRGGGHDHCLPHLYWRALSDHHQRVRGRRLGKGESHISGSDSMMTLKTRAGSNLSDSGSALVQKYCM